MSQKKAASAEKEYTLMLVPHSGGAIRSIKVPIKVVKIIIGIFCVVLLVLGGFGLKFTAVIQTAQAEKAELEALRKTNGDQSRELEELTKATETLQRDMDRLNGLDAEIRRMVNSSEQSAASRSGVARYQIANSGQGGPNVRPTVQELKNYIENLQQQVKEREESLINLRMMLAERNERLNTTPSLWPAEGEITSRFGWRSSPFGGENDWHPGVDIANSIGTPIVAAAAGQVVYSGWYSGYGKMVQIDHGNGMVTVYAHNSRNIVQEGQYVQKGDLIAYMGSTGLSTGSHVHYEVRVNGTAVNPVKFFSVN